MSRKNNLILISITLVLYLINQCLKTEIPIEPIRLFMSCYFNDMIGGITFCAYCSLMLSLCNKSINKLFQILLLMFFCGIFWEYVTPLFRLNTVSDPFDILAYILGGIIYWSLLKYCTKGKNINSK